MVSSSTTLPLSSNTPMLPRKLARLIHPTAGTVVRLEGDLEAFYRAGGWADADAPAQQDEAPSEKPKPTTRRPRKPRT
jgi:hypothetical protein